MPFSFPLRRSLRSTFPLLLGALTLCVGSLPAATSTDPATGTRLLRAQLPSNVSAAVADCEQLSRAVVRAIYVDRVHAPDILAAALGDGLDRREPLRRSCQCVVHIFRNAVIVAPRQDSGLLETAASLYPDCAEALSAALDAAGDKNPVVAVVDGKDRGPAADSGNNAARNQTPSGDLSSVREPGAFGGIFGDPGSPSDLGDRDLSGLGFGLAGSPGFPGSPGFVGSVASGGVALPPPVSAPVTSVVNQ